MDQKWTQLDPPTSCPAPLPVRGMACLARSEHPAFPENVPYAVESVPGFAPNRGLSPESAGRLAREIMENELGRYPALILKNFPIHSRCDFSRFIEAMSLVRHGYEGGVALRDQANDGVNVASTEPPEVVISPHNEIAYMPSPPAIVIFHCMQAASHGGEVPVNDARKVPRSLPVTFVREMRERGVRYSRRVPRKNASLEVGWEHQFSTTEKSVVERHLAGEGITYHWEADDLLRFWFERPVFRTYRDEEVWFNQLSESNAEWWLCHPVFQAMGITREMVQSDTAYGDGEPFPEEVTAMVRGAIWQTTELVKLEPTDILVLDNFIAQHGRLSYHGTRKHHVALIKDPLM